MPASKGELTMTRVVELEIANFVCRFGTKLVLNDLLDEVVLPAFFNPQPRQYGEAQFFFTEQRFEYLRKNDVTSLALRCRFIYSTILRRHQVYSPGQGLRADEKSIDSAPSALAILLLKSHRLLYVREVPHAPSPKQFGTTFAHFLRLAMIAHHNSRFEQSLRSGTKLSKRAIREQFPFAKVDVVPVVSSESLKHFVRRFDSLKSLRIELAPTNSELDNNEFFQQLRLSKQKVASQKTVVQHQSAKGLDKDNCVAHIEAAKQGNALIQMKGVDSNGDELKGNNDNFSVRASLEEVSEQIDTRAKDVFEKYEELVEKEVITLGMPTKDDSEKLKESFKRFHRGESK